MNRTPLLRAPAAGVSAGPPGATRGSHRDLTAGKPRHKRKEPKTRKSVACVPPLLVMVLPVRYASAYSMRGRLFLNCANRGSKYQVRSAGVAHPLGSRPSRSYSAMTCAPSSNTIVAISTLSRTAMAVVSDP